jgi:type 1 glutamine amidotransferase
VHAVVYTTKNWPKDLSQADSIIVGLNHGRRAARDPEIAKAAARGAGFMALHYGVEAEKGEQGDAYLKWMGGYFEAFYSVNPWWSPDFKTFPEHPITRGVEPFKIRDEWYYHMRFVDGMKGVTPILSAYPPKETLKRGDGAHSGNPHVRESVEKGEIQHVAWAYERPDCGRGFGFTGGHFHNNWGNDDFRTIVLNAITWVARAEVPADGVPSDKVTAADLEQNQDFPKPEKRAK